MAWSPDGKRLAAGHYPDIALWDEQGRKQATLTGHGGIVKSLRWSTDGGKLLSGCEDHTAKIWDVQTAQEMRSLNMHTSSVRTALWSPDDEYVLTVANEVKLTPLQRPAVTAVIQPRHSSRYHSVVWTPNGQELICGGGSHWLGIHDATSGEFVRYVAGSEDRPSHVRSLAWDRSGDRLASLMYDGVAAIWDERVERPLRILSLKNTLSGGNIAVAWSPDGALLTTGTHGDTGLTLWDTTTWRPVARPSWRDEAWCLAWNPNGRQLATGDGWGLSVFDVHERRIQYKIPLGFISDAVTWSHDGRFVAALPKTGGIPIVRASDGKVLLTLRGHQGLVTAVQWSPDGTVVGTSHIDLDIGGPALAERVARYEQDRAAAVWVLERKGQVSVLVNDRQQAATSLTELPPYPFRVVRVDLPDHPDTRDEDLARLAKLALLQELRLWGKGVTDAGLEHLADLTDLRLLNLHTTSVTGTGFRHLGRLDKLWYLSAGYGTPINDEGLEALSQLLSVTHFGCNTGRTSDEGLRHLSRMRGLRQLVLHWGKLSGEGFRHLTELPELLALRADHGQLTDDCLAHLGRIPTLQKLYLDANKDLTDAGLPHLYGLSNLQSLSLKETAVTKAGVEALQAKLPGCQVAWDGAP